MDEHNLNLLRNVHPSDWKNPAPAPMYNLVVIGAGTAGLVTAAGAAGLGAKVALIEKNLMGGDCLNVGCVPSKSVIRSSRALADARDGARFGLRLPDGAGADFGAVMERMRRIRSGLSGHDSAARFKGLGVDVFLGEARFTGPHTVETGGQALKFRKCAITSGARAAVPDIPGLKSAGFLTNETVFNLTAIPPRLACIGAGPIGCELAQAFQRLGSQVVLFHKGAHILDREDEDAAEILQKKFRAEGIELVLNSRIVKVESDRNGKTLHYESSGKSGSITVDEILVGAGRAPNVEGLNLEAAGVKFDLKKGVRVNEYLQTDNPDVFAAGDVCMRWKFTHAADAAARIVIQNALFFKSKKITDVLMPWVTYTDPEIAHVGLGEREAADLGVAVETLVRPFSAVDRAVADGEEEGFVKVRVQKGNDKILGATIVARHAGEMIGEWTLAARFNIGLGSMGSAIHPYPTQSEAARQLSDEYNRKRLTPFIKRIFSVWLKWRLN